MFKWPLGSKEKNWLKVDNDVANILERILKKTVERILHMMSTTVINFPAEVEKKGKKPRT